MRKTPTKYTADFKQKAVDLVLKGGHTPEEVAREIEVPNQLVYCWVKKHQEALEQGRSVFPGRGITALTDQEKRIRELEKEVENLRTEREILKAAAKFFGWSAEMISQMVS